MGNNACGCADSLKPAPVPKCTLLHQNLLAEFVLNSGQNNHLLQSITINTNKQCSKLPARYTDLYMLLKSSKTKFMDTYYSHKDRVTHKAIPTHTWSRLSDSGNLHTCNKQNTDSKRSGYSYKNNRNQKPMNALTSTAQDINRPQTFQKVPISKFCQVIKFICKNYSDLAELIQPIYIPSQGLSIAKLWIQGHKTEIIIDDYVPPEKFIYNVQPWVILLQKAMAKVLGQYRYIQQFTLGEIFTQVTGIPHYSAASELQTEPKRKKSVTNSFKNFKDAIKCDQILYQTYRFRYQDSILGYRKGYKLSNISFEVFKNRPSIIKISNPKQQMTSLRVIEPLHKYRGSASEGLDGYDSKVFVQCFIEKNKKLYQYGAVQQEANCKYINGVFSEFEEGTFWLYIRHVGLESRLAIVAYSVQTIRLQQVFDDQYATTFPHKQISNKPNPQQKLQQINLSQNVRAHVQYLSRKVILYFDDNYQSTKLKIMGQDCIMFFQQQKAQLKQVHLNNVKNKYVIILKLKSEVNEKTFVTKILSVENF